MSLRKKAIGGVFWSIIDTFVLRGLLFLVTIVIARWIGPENYGLMGIVSIFFALGLTITDSGLSNSLIRTKNADDKDFSTVFYLNLALSAAVYIIVFIAAPFISSFFNNSLLTDIIRVYCLSFIFTALSAVQIARLTTQMDFKIITKYSVPPILISSFVGLLLGWYGYGIWALVWMNLLNNLLKSIWLWYGSSWRPTYTFSKDKARFHYTFGYRLMLSGLLNTIFQYLNNLIIGKFYPIKDLGYYERSKSLNDYPVTTITGVLSRVSFPLLSSISDDKNRIATVYRQLFGVSFFITAPLMFGLSAIAEPLFLLILGKEWMGAVPYFQVLCYAGMFYPIHAFNLNVFKVYGRSDLFLKLEIIKKVTVLIIVLIAMRFGIIGLVWGSVVQSVLSLFINTYYMKGLINYSNWEQFKDLLPTYITSILMYFGVVNLLSLLNGLHSVLQLIISIGAGVVFYLILNYLIKNYSFIFITKMIKEKLFKS